MANRKRIIITTNREIYEKFNMLKLSQEVILRDVKKLQIDKILKTINKNNQILDIELLGDYILVKKINPINFDIYMKNGVR